jgi:HD superfamily phosphohydrolase YqeK
VLDAVRYHSIGLAEWDMVGRMLYCADYLEPGRKHEREWRAELAERLPAQPALVIRQVARARVGHMVSSGRTLPEPTVRFWNSLVAASSASS